MQNHGKIVFYNNKAHLKSLLPCRFLGVRKSILIWIIFSKFTNLCLIPTGTL